MNELFGDGLSRRWSGSSKIGGGRKEITPLVRIGSVQFESPLLEFNIGSHPGDSTHYVNARDMLSLSLLQARLIDLGMPIKIVEGT
jgi:hypothetical protein